MIRTQIDRIRTLAGLNEAPLDILSPDEAMDDDDRAYDAQRAREQKVEALIAAVFRKLGIGVEQITYDEGMDREAEVTLDDFEIDVARLAGLIGTGLAGSYRLVARDHSLAIGFTVAEGLENATMGGPQ